MTWPRPRHTGHGPAVTIWPRIDWRTWRTWPAPPHSGQVSARVPGAAPGGLAVVAGDRGADADLFLGAEHGLLERRGDGGLEVGAGRRARRAPLAEAAAGAAEEGVEDVADAARTAEAERVAAGACRRSGPNWS